MVLRLVVAMVLCVGGAVALCVPPPTSRSPACRAENVDAEALLAEARALREEIAADEAALIASRPVVVEEPAKPKVSRSRPFSRARCAEVYCLDDKGLPVGVPAWSEKERFAEAMRFGETDRYHYVVRTDNEDGRKVVTAALGSDVADLLASPTPSSEPREYLKGAEERFRSRGLFPDILGSEDFDAVAEVASLARWYATTDWTSDWYGMEWHEQTESEADLVDGLTKRSDEVGQALWRRWKRVARDRFAFQRSGELRERLASLELSELKFDLSPNDSVWTAADDTHEKLLSMAPQRGMCAPLVEAELLELAGHWRKHHSFELRVVSDYERRLIDVNTAWDALRFARRSARARACALGLALDAILVDGIRDLDDTRYVTELKRAGFLRKGIGLGLTVFSLNMASKAGPILREVQLALFFAACFCLYTDPQVQLAIESVIDRIFFGSTDNRLDILAAYDLKFNTHLLDLPHPPTEKYPDSHMDDLGLPWGANYLDPEFEADNFITDFLDIEKVRKAKALKELAAATFSSSTP